MLLDEPTNGLDVASSLGMRDLMRRMRDEGRCVLLASHLVQEVAALCDRIVVIGEGRVLADGTLEALRAQTGKHDVEEAFMSATGTTRD